MNNMQQAIIMTIHQEPQYVFSSGENSAARKMEKAKWLRSLGGGKFAVTKKGEKEYKSHGDKGNG